MTCMVCMYRGLATTDITDSNSRVHEDSVGAARIFGPNILTKTPKHPSTFLRSFYSFIRYPKQTIATMPVSIKKLMTMSMDTVQRTTNRLSTQEWYAMPAASSSLSTTAASLEQQTQSSSADSTKNLFAIHDSLQAPPRKGSWDNSFMPEQDGNKEESELESMIQCTSTFC